MLVPIKTDKSVEYINHEQVTKMFYISRDAVRINLTCGSYVVTEEDIESLRERLS